MMTKDIEREIVTRVQARVPEAKLQVKDVVRLLHCSKNTVYALIKSGTLECVKVGRNLLIPKALLVEFLMRDKNIYVLRPDPPRRR